MNVQKNGLLSGLLRFIAVTRPIQYAKHRNTYRIPLTIALTWVVSVLISSPIVLGANYTERRSESPTLCTFYNADFIIYSSMGSFYLPCVAMLLLYWKVFRVINDRIRRSRLHDAPVSSTGNDAMTTVQQRQITTSWRQRMSGRQPAFVRAVFHRYFVSLYYAI